MTKARNTQIDIARGLAIFSVVYGHIATGLLSKTIYLFHMPFFFMVSGYFHKVEPQEGKYLKKKGLSLLVPYFMYFLHR
ncbi:MAG: acyltransferase family protein [Cyanobacteria bacterium J06598_3]